MGKVDSHSKEKIWENTKISKLRFLIFFFFFRNPCSSQNMEKVDFNSTGKVWENTNILNLWGS